MTLTAKDGSSALTDLLAQSGNGMLVGGGGRGAKCGGGSGGGGGGGASGIFNANGLPLIVAGGAGSYCSIFFFR